MNQLNTPYGQLVRVTSCFHFHRDFDVVIVDEAHERHLNTDLALGLLKRLTHRRPEFRLVIMSATIDLDMFAVSLFYFSCGQLE